MKRFLLFFILFIVLFQSTILRASSVDCSLNEEELSELLRNHIIKGPFTVFKRIEDLPEDETPFYPLKRECDYRKIFLRALNMIYACKQAQNIFLRLPLPLYKGWDDANHQFTKDLSITIKGETYPIQKVPLKDIKENIQSIIIDSEVAYKIYKAIVTIPHPPTCEIKGNATGLWRLFLSYKTEKTNFLNTLCAFEGFRQIPMVSKIDIELDKEKMSPLEVDFCQFRKNLNETFRNQTAPLFLTQNHPPAVIQLALQWFMKKIQLTAGLHKNLCLNTEQIQRKILIEQIPATERERRRQKALEAQKQQAPPKKQTAAEQKADALKRNADVDAWMKYFGPNKNKKAQQQRKKRTKQQRNQKKAQKKNLSARKKAAKLAAKKATELAEQELVIAPPKKANRKEKVLMGEALSLKGPKPDTPLIQKAALNHINSAPLIPLLHPRFLSRKNEAEIITALRERLDLLEAAAQSDVNIAALMRLIRANKYYADQIRDLSNQKALAKQISTAREQEIRWLQRTLKEAQEKNTDDQDKQDKLEKKNTEQKHVIGGLTWELEQKEQENELLRQQIAALTIPGSACPTP